MKVFVDCVPVLRMSQDHLPNRTGRRPLILLLAHLHRPATAKQLARRLDLPVERCSKAFRRLAAKGFVYCMNPLSLGNRFYWLTVAGSATRNLLVPPHMRRPVLARVPNVDWELYASVCYRQRSAVLKSLQKPGHLAEIARRAKQQNPGLRLSASNAHAVVQYFRQRGLARTTETSGHGRVELTNLGREVVLFLVDRNAWYQRKR